MVGADVSGHYPESLRHHLEEDWLHHLRDDSLVLARWEVDSLTRHLTRSLGEHDRFGAAPVWRHLPGCALAPETDPGDGRQWFNASPEELRLRTAALQTLALALPGSVYLRQGDEIGLPDDQRSAGPAELAGIVAEQSPLQSQRLGSSLANVRHAVRLRRERRLAAAPLAFVTGMDWSRPDVFTLLVRDVLVVVNTAHHPVALPERTEVLLSSQMLGRAENRLVVPPTTTVWLDAATAA